MTDKFPDGIRSIEELLSHILSNTFQGRETGPGMMGINIIIAGENVPSMPGRREGGNPPHDSDKPEIEVIEADGWIILTCPLPGLEKEHIKVAFGDGQIHIVGFDGERRYKTSAVIPDVDLDSCRQTLHNGVLELSYRLANTATGGVVETEREESTGNIKM
ncbi:MAG: Hsp20/alpha crystallin family protein [Methanomicrobiales archaeon]|jgi:HSP20 family molecular chaperone IbpA|nr:Hsp20/alpha crystallin family protein [Methanomicrobiales archaeon]